MAVLIYVDGIMYINRYASRGTTESANVRIVRGMKLVFAYQGGENTPIRMVYRTPVRSYDGPTRLRERSSWPPQITTTSLRFFIGPTPPKEYVHGHTLHMKVPQ